MTSAGTLQASCNGRPVQLVAEGGRLVLRLRGWRDIWSMRRSVGALGAVAPLLERAGMQLAVRIGTGRDWPVLPRPHPVARWLLPKASGRSMRR